MKSLYDLHLLSFISVSMESTKALIYLNQYLVELSKTYFFKVSLFMSYTPHVVCEKVTNYRKCNDDVSNTTLKKTSIPRNCIYSRNTTLSILCGGLASKRENVYFSLFTWNITTKCDNTSPEAVVLSLFHLSVIKLERNQDIYQQLTENKNAFLGWQMPHTN